MEATKSGRAYRREDLWDKYAKQANKALIKADGEKNMPTKNIKE
jgi:hypothetical protein